MSSPSHNPPPGGQTTLVTQLYIKRNGVKVDELLMRSVIHVTVDQHAYLPDTFAVHLVDNHFNLIDSDKFALGDTLEIGVFHPASRRPIQLIVGETTALEPDFAASHAAHLVVRGYDRSHRLYRQTKSRAFVNMKDSDIAKKLAQEANLQCQVTPTTIVYDHVFQDNQTDLALLHERAWRIGFECYVRDRTLYFEKADAHAPSVVTLNWGESLLEVHPRMHLSEQFNEVIVRGWDPIEQRPIIGKAQNGALAPDNQMLTKARLDVFGQNQMVVVDQFVANQSDADLLANARINEVSGAVMQVDGSVQNHPEIQAGKSLELKGLGQRFSGTYWVTHATHTYQVGSGISTHFSVSGLRNGLLLDQLRAQRHLKRWNGVALGIVTNINDPDNNARVKVKYPWLSDNVESYWARVVMPGHSVALPNVGDEVLVGFEQGDINRPYIIGRMPRMKRPSARGEHRQDPHRSGSPSQNKITEYQSPGGHKLIFNDNTGQQSVTLVSKNGHKLKIDDNQNNIQLETKSGYRIQLDDGTGTISVQGNELKIHTARNMQMESDGDINLTARGKVNVRGSQIHLN